MRFILFFWFSAKIGLLVWPTLSVESVDWLVPIIVSLLYILISVFILIAWDTLADYNIDILSLILFILFGTIFRFDKIASNNVGIVCKVIVWIMAAIILFRIIRNRFWFPLPEKGKILFVVIGLLSGALFSIGEAYLIVHKPGFQSQPVDTSLYTSVNYLVRALAYDASNGAVTEEFVFRGLFLGFLVKEWHNEKKAYLIQGLIFWLSHFDRILVSPIGFWIVLPISTLLFTLLAWRSRSLAPSIAAHTTFNTLQVVFAIIMMARL